MLRIGHRGAAAHAPENTVASFRRAVELDADAVEFDVQRTRDGALVVIHDETVDRTTNGSGRVGDLTFGEVRALDAGVWKGREFAGERVPTLEEAIDAVPERIRLFVELKDPALYPGIEAQVLGVLGERNALRRAEVSSFDHDALARVRAADADVAIGLLFSRHPDPVPAARRLRARALHVGSRALTGDLVANAHAAGLAVYVWTVNDPADIAAARALGVDGMFSDHPERLVA